MDLVIYNHFRREGHPVYTANLDFFLKLGLCDSDKVDFVFVINNHKVDCVIPGQKNVRIISRDNIGYDFGAYKAGIEAVDIEDYDRFIFMNDTCRGPFLPSYIPKDIVWTDLFLSGIDNNVKMVGPTWYNSNETKHPTYGFHIKKHIQSFCFGMDRVALDILLSNDKFDSENKDRSDVILDHEIGCSQCLIDKGYLIKPLQLSQFSQTSHADIHFPDKYFGDTLNPLDVMFVKTNRINNNVVRNYTDWLMTSTDVIVDLELY